MHDICRQHANVIFAIDRAGFVGADGETHQGIYDIAFMRHIPNIVIMMPKDENELRHMMKTAVDYDAGPIAIRYPRNNSVGVPIDEVMKPIPIGTWEVVRPGDSAVVLAIGPMIQVAEEAAEQLKREGISLRIVNARFIKPLDETMLLQLSKEHLPIIVMEEACSIGSLGSAVLEFYAAHHIQQVNVTPIGVPDYFVEHGSIEQQREEVGLTSERLVNEVKTILFSRGDNRLPRAHSTS